MRVTWGRPTSVVIAAALVLGGCSRGATKAAPAGDAVTGPRSVYVAIGASETVGVGGDEPLRDAWTKVLYRSALPRRTIFYNLGVRGTTVADALDQQVPEALRLKPTLVTVWLNVNDLLRSVTPATYEERLTRLLTQLRRDGATRVLVANTPPLDLLPAYLGCRNPSALLPECPLDEAIILPPPEVVRAAVDAYNQTIGRAAAASGAQVVDLAAVTLAARAAGTDASLVSADGFHPSSAGYRAVARAFAAVLRGGRTSSR